MVSREKMKRESSRRLTGLAASFDGLSALLRGETRGGRNSQERKNTERARPRLSSATPRRLDSFQLAQPLETAAARGRVMAAADPPLTSFETHFLHLRNPFFVRAKVG